MQAVSLPSITIPDGPTFPTSDGPDVVYPLGAFTADSKGDAKIKDVVPLPATHDSLPFGVYSREIMIINASDEVVLQTVLGDECDFQVFP